ncbi:MAG: monomethylamine:corrinoid methyltransferase [Spirochaetota bacterium]
MITFWDVVERCSDGERMKESAYDALLWKHVSEIIKTYNIKFNPDQIIPGDDSLADRAFEAGLELFRQVGFYCLDTQRVVRFSRNEIEDRLRIAPDKYVWGEGKDQGITIARKVEDPRDPSFVASGLGVPVPQDMFVKVCQALASVPLADAFCGVSLYNTFRGIPIRAGNPIEVAAAIWDVSKRREAARLAGRPGLGLYAMISCAESTTAIIAAAREQFGALKNDVTQNGAIAELKVDFARMNKVPWQMESGAGIAGLYGPLMGGYAGGPEGTMLTQIAHFFLGLFAFNADYHIPFPIDINQVCNTSSPMLWLVSVYSQAIARNTHLLNESVAMAAAGPATKMLFYELAAHAITATVSGGNLVSAGIARDKYPERVSTLEIQTGSEVGHIAARMGMTRKDANEVVKKLIARYEKDILKAPLGKKFGEIYDLEKVKPRPEYQIIYDEVQGELKDLGLNYALL